VDLGVSTQASRRPVRARIRAYGTSNAGFATQNSAPYLLSSVVTVIRDSEYKASGVVPGRGSNIGHPLSVFPSLHRVLWDQFPGFISTMRVLRLPAAHPTALRFLRLAVPRVHSLVRSLEDKCCHQGLELVTR